MVKLYNRNVLALRPLGYKPTPSAGLALTPQMLGIPKDGDWVAFVCSGPRRDGDVSDHANQLNIRAPVIPFDIGGGEMHDILTCKFVDTLIDVVNARPTGPAASASVVSSLSGARHGPPLSACPTQRATRRTHHVCGHTPCSASRMPTATSRRQSLRPTTSQSTLSK
jgi:hypothetical protein